MPEYRIRYTVGDGKYHSVTVSADEPPTYDEATQAAFLQERHLYDEEGADDLEVDDIRELAPIPIIARTRARFVLDPETGEWTGPLFDGPAHGLSG